MENFGQCERVIVYSINMINDIHVFVGGNTDLRGFEQRFSRDLRELLPEHSPIINVRSYPGGTKSINAVMGAHAVPVPIPYGK